MVDFISMDKVIGEHEVGFIKTYFYAIGIHGIDIYSLSEKGPFLSCDTFSSSKTDSSKLVGEYTYKLRFFERNC